ncbi:MAG: ABC transporter ATP-binding protein [Thaumarchaeota archaeon]|nr:ABC transporter ATP-binding protein [Nitrososphaerota archaeon]
MPLLEVKDLEVSFRSYIGEIRAVRGVSFAVNPGEILGVVGESGCGKSVTMRAVTRLLPKDSGSIKNGSVNFNGVNFLNLKNKQMEEYRGRDIGMIFQDPMTSLNPTMTIGRQIGESLMKHKKVGKKKAREAAISLLQQVEISNPETRVDQYPHQFSGGMSQRAMIALAIACRPKLLIADEPTTALDVTIQAQILDLLRELRSQLGMSMILITHDLGVIADIADRVVVMYAGKIVESGTVQEIFYHPLHPYTQGLLQAIPRLDQRGDRLLSIPGSPPDLFNPPVGCSFYPRCPQAMRLCKSEQPPVFNKGPHVADCWLLHPALVAPTQTAGGYVNG